MNSIVHPLWGIINEMLSGRTPHRRQTARSQTIADPPKRKPQLGRSLLQALRSREAHADRFGGLYSETREHGLHAAVHRAFPSTPLLQGLEAAGRSVDGGDTQETYRQIDDAVQTLNRIMPQSTYSEERKMFCLLGGAKLLAEAFSWLAAMWPAGWPWGGEPRSDRNESRFRAEATMLSLLAQLRDCLFDHPSLCEAVAYDDGFVTDVFYMTASPQLRDWLMAILEELTLVRTTIIDLALWLNIGEQLKEFSAAHLSYFCRALSAMIYDTRDRYTSSSDTWESFDYKEPVQRTTAPTTVDRNLAIVLGIPGLLERMVKMLRCNHINWPAERVPVTDGEHTVNMLYDMHNFDALDTSASTRAGRENHVFTQHNIDTLVTELAHLRSQRPTASAGVPTTRLQTLALSAYHLEVLQFFCILLKSKRKMEVTVRLYAAGIMDVIDDIFNALDWDQPCLSSQEHFARIHGPGCECNVDSNLKVQFLRMLQALGKFSVSSPMVKEIDAVQGELLRRQPPSLPKRLATGEYKFSNQALLWAGSASSVFHRLVSIYKRTSDDAAYKFWLTNVMEGLLRTSRDDDQLLVLESGVQEMILDRITAEGFHCVGELQASFDLLGELVRFSVPAYSRLVTHLGRDKAEHFYTVIRTNLLDSNVFLRALVLTLDYYGSPEALGIPPGYLGTHRVLADAVQRDAVALSAELLALLTADTVNQENVCCLNTSLIFFLLARRRGEMLAHLEAVEAYDADQQRIGERRSLSLRENLRQLLHFWLNIYQKRARDCYALEASTRVSFQEWRSLVHELKTIADAPSAWAMEKVPSV